MKCEKTLHKRAVCAAFACFAIICNLAIAADWTTYQHDNSRSGVTSESLNLPLGEQWRYISKHAPRQAWPEPARQDFWHNLYGLRAKVRYDQTFHLVVAGNAAYFGSSADDKVYCLDVSTGEERWSFFTGGPVRLAPTIWDGKVYFGSDDGCAYCLKTGDGELVWKYKAAPDDRMIPGNSRMISACPVRTSVLVRNGVAYFCAGLFPKEGVYLCALNADNGTEIWKQTTAISPQGYLLSSETRLYVPTGRTAPAIFNREDGKSLGGLSCPLAEGGTYALLTGDTLVSGPGKGLRAFDTGTKDQIATFAGHRMIVADKVSYLLSDSKLSAIDRAAYSTVMKRRAEIVEERKKLAGELSPLREKRKELKEDELETLDEQINDMVEKMAALDGESEKLKDAEYKWRRASDRTYNSMILTGDLLFVGGDSEVVALRISDGEQVWNGKTEGNAYGLAVANGSLFVSTDSGIIHCFGKRSDAARRYIVPNRPPSPYVEDELTEKYASVAKRVIDETGIKKGYCLVLGCGEGRLAYELAKRTELRIVGIEEDEKKVLAARKSLDKAGLYGVRVAVHQGNLERLPYTDYFANLVVTEGLVTSDRVSTAPDEILRVLRPYGGTAYLVDGITKRERLKNAGEWTHQYANPGNTACSEDRLVQGAMQVQWFGEPGPRAIIDRHLRALGPLFKDGRLFVPAAGENRVIAVDAYNGTILWDVEVPNYRRVGANRDTGNMALTDDYLYVATEGNCWLLDVATGEHAFTFGAPQPHTERHQWGYIASAGNLLFGSGQKKDTPYTKHRRSTISGTYYDNKPIATSDYLFCLDRHNGEQIWRYDDGIIINPAIAVSDRHIYFVESRNPAVNNSGRVKLKVLFASGYGYIVALDRQTGKKVWERQVDFSFEHAAHLSYARNTVLALGTTNEDGHPRYDMYAFNADDGSDKWSTSSIRANWGAGGSHGEQDQHAVIAGDGIYMIESHNYNLQTGEEGGYKLNRGGHGCGTLSGSASYLFARGGNPRMYKIAADGKESGAVLTNVSRPGCWINIIPAGGLVLIPEFSAGCSCAYPIQASIVLMPTNNVEGAP